MKKPQKSVLFAGAACLVLSMFICGFPRAVGAYPLSNVASYSSAANPQGLAVADFNNDSRPDFAAVGYGGNRVSVFLSNGYGSFASAVDYGVSTSPWGIAAADFNGDGYNDLVVSNSGSNTISYLQNNGNGTFAAAVNYATGNSPRGMAVGDFNGDGRKDLAVANMSANTVSVLTGNGDGTFNAKVDYAVGNYPANVTVSDFNNDGKADLAAANSCAGCFIAYGSGSVSVLTGKGDGTFNAAQNFTTSKGAVDIVSGDFNGDGNQDVAVVKRTGNNAGVLLGNGDGTLQAVVDYSVGTFPMGMAEGDFNQDGHPDLVAADTSDNTLSFLTGVGNGTFSARTTSTADANPWSVAVGDFNQDDKMDLVESNRGAGNVGLYLDTSLPAITGLSPSAAYSGSGSTDVIISGSGFEPDSSVEVDGNTYTTTFTSSTQVKIQLSDADLAGIGEKSLQVYNPSIDDYSNTATFTIQAAPAAPAQPGGGLPAIAFSKPTAPAGGFKLIINDGASNAPSRQVNLKMMWQGAADPKATRFAVSNDPNFTAASLMDIAGSDMNMFPWDLCALSSASSCINGAHTVYAKFYTSWGQSSEAVSSDINLASAVSGNMPTAEHAQAGAGPAKSVFTRALRLGDAGADVKALQAFLNANGAVVSASGPGSTGNETAYFGLKTQTAVKEFQEAHADEILKPLGLSSGTGFFGASTRAFVNSMM